MVGLGNRELPGRSLGETYQLLPAHFRLSFLHFSILIFCLRWQRLPIRNKPTSQQAYERCATAVDLGEALAPLLAQSTPGEEVQLLNPTPDGNGGLPLPTELVFGEVVVLEPVSLELLRRPPT